MDDLLDGDGDESGRRVLEQHVADCEACARQWEEMRSVEQWARGLQPVPPGARFADRVMARIEAEQPVYETSTAGIEFIAAILLAAAVAPMFLGANDALYDGVVAATGSIGGLFGSVATEIGDAGRQAFAGVAALWSWMNQWQGPLSPAWMTLLAVAAVLVMVVFNVVQARKAVQRA
jgi:anti-sigma factor RsiW